MGKPRGKKGAKAAPKGTVNPKSRHPSEELTYHADVSRRLQEGTPEEAAEFLSRLIFEGDPSKPGFSGANLGPTLEVIADLNPRVRTQYLDAVLASMNVPPDQIAAMPLAQKVNVLPEYIRPAFLAEQPDLTLGTTPGSEVDMEGDLLAEPPAEIETSRARRQTKKQQLAEARRRGVEAADMVPRPAPLFVETRPDVTPAALPRRPGEREVLVDAPGEDWTDSQVSRGWRRVTFAPDRPGGRQTDVLEILRDRAPELTAEPAVTPAAIPEGAEAVRDKKGRVRLLDPNRPADGLRMVGREVLGLPPSQSADASLVDAIMGGDTTAKPVAVPQDDAMVDAIMGGSAPLEAGSDKKVSVLTDVDQMDRRDRLATYTGGEVAQWARDRARGQTNDQLTVRTADDAESQSALRETLLARYLRPQLKGQGGMAGIIARQNRMLLDPANRPMLERVQADLGLTGTPEQVVAKIPLLYRMDNLQVPEIPMGLAEQLPHTSKAGDVRALDQLTLHLMRHADPAYQAVMGIEPRAIGEMLPGGKVYEGANLDRLLGGIQRGNFLIPDPDGVLYNPGRPSGEMVANWLVSTLVDKQGLDSGLARRIAPAIEDSMQATLMRPPSKGRMAGVSQMAGRTYQPKQGMSLLRDLAIQAQRGRDLAELPDFYRPDEPTVYRDMGTADWMSRMWVPRTGDEWQPTAAVSVRNPGLPAAEAGGGLDVSRLIGGQPAAGFSADDFVKAGTPAQPASTPAGGGLVNPNEGTPFQPGDFEKVDQPADFDLEAYEREYGYDPTSDEPDPNDFSYMMPPMNRAMAQRALLSGLLA
jgi:hypothetical protein